MRVNGVVGPDRRVHRGHHHHQPRPDRRRLVADRRARAARRGVQLRGRRGLLAAQRPRPAADDPGRLPGRRSRRSSRRSSRSCSSIPGRRRPDAEAIFSILWLGILGSGLAYLLVFRLFSALGRDADDARRLRHPGRRDHPRVPRARRADRRPASSSGPGSSSPASALRQQQFGRRRCSGARARRSRRAEPTATRPEARDRRPQLADRQQQRARRRSAPTPRSAAPPRDRSVASPMRYGAPGRREDRRRFAQRRDPDSGATLSATRMHR